MSKIFTGIMLIVCVASLWGAARMNTALAEFPFRRAMARAAPVKNAPPLVAFTTVALGGFRGLIADALWMRALRLQEDGQVFELVQLADWVTQLEPHFKTVWTFQAWNMAYNIGILFDDSADRWRWVSRAIELLRDGGLKYNPTEPEIYRELGWIYQHKIGYVMDKAHWYFKQQLVEQMAAYFDGPRPDYAKAAGDPRLIRMKEVAKLDPVVMETIEKTYGPLDWRLAATHSVYWAWRGRVAAADPEKARSCVMMVFQSLAESFRHGRLMVNPANNRYVMTPNMEILPGVLKAFEDTISRYKDDIFRNAHRNFMGEAVLILNTYGRIREAQALFDELARRYAGPDVDGGYDAFVTRNYEKIIRSMDEADAMAFVEGLLFQRFFWQAMGDEDRAAKYDQMAGRLWKRYMDGRASEEHRERTGLPTLDVIRRQAWQRAVTEIPQTNLTQRLKDLGQP